MIKEQIMDERKIQKNFIDQIKGKKKKEKKKIKKIYDKRANNG